jgi:hypothetical protein
VLKYWLYGIHAEARGRRSNPQPNFSQQLMAGRSPRSGLKPLFLPRRNGVTPLADAARRRLVSCGKRRAALAARMRGRATAE